MDIEIKNKERKMKPSEYLKSKCSIEQYYNFFGTKETLPKEMDEKFVERTNEEYNLHYMCNKCGDTFELNSQNIFSAYCFHCGKGLLQLIKVEKNGH